MQIIINTIMNIFQHNKSNNKIIKHKEKSICHELLAIQSRLYLALTMHHLIKLV